MAVAEGRDGELSGVVVREELYLFPVDVEGLTEVALLPEYPHTNQGDAQVAGRLQVVAGQDAEAAAVDGERLGEAELHAEIGHLAQQRGGDGNSLQLLAVLRVPGRAGQQLRPLVHVVAKESQEIGILGELFQSVVADGLEDVPGTVRPFPDLRREPLPDVVGRMAPGPAHVQGEIDKAAERLGYHRQGGCRGRVHHTLPSSRRSGTLISRYGNQEHRR